MKKNFIWCIVFASLLSFVACESGENASSPEKGKVMVDLSSDVSYPAKGAKTKALDLTSYADVNNYTVEILNEGGSVIQSKLYGEMDLVQDITPGTYTIKAFYGENVPGGFDKLYVEGSQLFTVSSGDTKKVTFVCTPANAKVKIVYSEDFFNFYSDCTVGLKTKHLTSPFEMAKEDKDKDLFLKTDASGETLTVTFDLKDLKGISIIPENFEAQTVQVNPRDFLTITIKPKLTEIEGGKISGITVTVDDGLKEEIIDVLIPDDFLPSNDSEVNN